MEWEAKMEIYGPITAPTVHTFRPGVAQTADQLLGWIRNVLLDVIVNDLEDGKEEIQLLVEIDLQASREALSKGSSSKPSGSESTPPTTTKSSARTRRSGSS